MKIRRLIAVTCLIGASLGIAAPAQAWECENNKCEEVKEEVTLIVCGLRPGGCI